MFARMHNAVIIWKRDIGLSSLFMRKAVYWSESQNRYTQMQAWREIKDHTPADPLWPIGHRWASLLPISIHTPPIYVFSPCLLLQVRSLFFFIPLSFSSLSFTLPCIFDYCGWKPVDVRSLIFFYFFIFKCFECSYCIWVSVCVFNMSLLESWTKLRLSSIYFFTTLYIYCANWFLSC